MAKGNQTGQGQYRPSARKTLTNAPSAQVRTPSTGNDFLSGIGNIGDILGDINGTGLGGSFRNTGVSGVTGGYKPYGQLMMGNNPWNQGMTGGNSFSMFDPWSMFGENKTNFSPKPTTPTTPTAPTAPGPKTYNANEASQKLREGLNRDLSNDEIGQLMGVLGKKSTDTFTDDDIARAKTLVGQNRPGYITPTGQTQIDTGGRGIPNPTLQAAQPMPSPTAPNLPVLPNNPAGSNLDAMNQQLRARLTRDLSGDEIGMLTGALAGNLNVDAATNLIRQYKPELLRG